MRRAPVETLRQDARFALRGVARSPGLFAVIILTIGLGVGANAAMFAVLDRVLFRQPAGVARPAEVRRIYSYGRVNNSTAHYADWFSAPDLDGMRAATGGVADVEGYYEDDGWLADGDSLRVQATRVTAGYFHMLGVGAERGRLFAADEMRYGDPRYVVVLSDALWRRRFGADPSIIGRTIHVAQYRDTTAWTVVGIAQPGFAGVDLDGDDMWVPVTARPSGSGEGTGAWWTQRGLWVVSLLVRVPAGADVRAVDARLTMAYRQVNATAGAWFDRQARAVTAPLIEARGPGGSSAGDRNVALATRLAGMALVVLALAAANAAALLLMRALRRRREIAIRVALGVSRSRLVVQLLIEVLVAGLVAGAGALLMTLWTGRLLRVAVFRGVHWAPGVVDGRLVAVVAILAVVASLAAGLAPIAVLGRRDLTDALKTGSQEAGHPGSRTRSGLLIAQTAMCVALLAGAGVFIQSLRRATALDLGMDVSRLIAVLASGYGTDPPVAAFDAAAGRLRALPIVTAVSRADGDGSGQWMAALRLPGQDSILPAQAPRFDMVDGAWFGVTGVRLVAGRLLTDEDVRAERPVAVVSAAMAARFWPGRSPIGACFFGMGPDCRRVVGVFADLRTDIATPAKPYYLIPTMHKFAEPVRPILLRLSRPATPQEAAMITSVARTAIGRTTAWISVIPYGARVEPQLRPWRVAGSLFTLFGLLALLSASAGVYGLVSYDVGRRTREIGVRTALGATPGRVVRDVLGPAVRVLLIGIGAGLVLAFVSGRLLAALLFETSPSDPPTLIATAATLLAVAVGASLIPAWRATRIDPVEALRTE